MIGLGILFSFAGFVILLVISIICGPVIFETGHATGLSAVVGGIIERLFNPAGRECRVRCCDVGNAKDFQAHFDVLRTRFRSTPISFLP